MITFQTEPFDAWLSAAQAILPAHWAEAATLPGHRSLKLAEDLYRVLEGAGRLVIVTVRDEGRLAGYLLGVLSPDLHSADTVTGIQDAYYLVPEWRGLFLKLVRTWEREAVARGATILAARQKVKAGGQPVPMDAILRRMGYSPGEKTWYKPVPKG